MRLAKAQTSVWNMHPVMWPTAHRIDELWWRLLGYELVIYSANDGVHSKGSRHPLGTALDLRTRSSMPVGNQLTGAARVAVLNALKELLGDDWFVLDEGDHFHIDYRPKTTIG